MKKILLVILILLGGIYALCHLPINISGEGDQKIIASYQEAAQKISEERRLEQEAWLHESRVQRAERLVVGTPLSGKARAMVECAERFNLPAGLLLGIARAESSFGRHFTLANNVWNWGYYLGVRFDSLESGACHVAQKLAENYDTSSVYAISQKYAPKSDGNNPLHWTQVVSEVIYQVN